MRVDGRPCDVCDKEALYTRFHEKYPTHTYTVCEDHDNEETVAKLVAEYEAYMAKKEKSKVFISNLGLGVAGDPFKALCHEMYKNFGGAHKNLLALCKTQGDKDLLVAQLHELRDSVRAQFEQIKEAGKVT